MASGAALEPRHPGPIRKETSMRTIRQAAALASFAALLVGANPAAAQFYLQTNLVSDLPGVAQLQDTSLVNSWGLAASPKSPWWVANNGTDSSTLYNTSGPVTKVPITALPCHCVIVPGAPTGLVFNGNMASFIIPGGAAARFIFDAEDGSISGWAGGTTATVIIQPSDKVYKGLAIASTAAGDFLYATDFHDGNVDVYNSSFVLQNMPGAFTDPTIPKGYAPFGIRNLEGIIYVTYALQDSDAHDDVPGVGHGFVNAFTTDGTLIRRVASKGPLNSPWGLELAPAGSPPAGFGKFGGDLLVGNFGDGKIHAYDPGALLGNGEFKRRGVLHSADGPPLKIDGLWALAFGNDHAAGPSTTLFFTSGPQGESHGIFGSLVVAPPPGGNHGDDDED
jgi:uncharacterized protein (TIGR03118 family)